MKTIESLSGTPNGAGTFSETYGILSANLWEHPDLPGWFIQTTLGAGGIKFTEPTTQTVIAINYSDLFALATVSEPNLFPVLPAVTASPTSGVHPQTVTLACTRSGVTIRYTTDGTTPTGSSTAYTVPLNIAAATTLKAKAFKTYWQASPLATFTYT